MHRSVLDPCSTLRVQTWDAAAPVPQSLETALGTRWPRQAGVVANGRAEVICVGPTDWLVIAAAPHSTALLQQLNNALEASAFRATDVSQALVRILLEGPAMRTLLAKGCALDLHPSCFPLGRSARTRLAGIPVIVRCTQPTTFECIVTRSYAEYLLLWLDDAAVEFSEPHA
jgi:sarcosine oxidase subunit gamma